METINAFFAIVIPLAAVGVVQFYNQLKTHDYEGAITIVVAAVVGLVAGICHFMGLDIATALTFALAAVGIHTATTKRA